MTKKKGEPRKFEWEEGDIVIKKLTDKEREEWLASLASKDQKDGS